MARFPKPAEGSWTQHYPELGTGPVSYHDSISPEIYELERNAIFKRAWLNVGRVEQLPRKGSYFTKEMKAANTSIILVRNKSGDINAFHNVCRHRGNKLVWDDIPAQETKGTCRQFTCKYHAWRFDLDGKIIIAGPGETIMIPSMTWHAVETLEDAIALDTFSPPREDFRSTIATPPRWS